MTMFLPNSAVRPTGYEAGEFIDIPDPLDRGRAGAPSDASSTPPPPPASALQPDHRETMRE